MQARKAWGAPCEKHTVKTPRAFSRSRCGCESHRAPSRSFLRVLLIPIAIWIDISTGFARARRPSASACMPFAVGKKQARRSSAQLSSSCILPMKMHAPVWLRAGCTCSTRVCCAQLLAGVMLLVCAEVILCWSCHAGMLYVLCWDRMIVRCFQERDPS